MKRTARRTVLFALELGGGWGHLGKIQPLANELLRQGHRVVVATPQMSAATRILQQTPCELLATPSVERRPARIAVSRTFAHVLLNTAFRDAAELNARCQTWRAIFNFVAPETIVCEHAPAALLAARTTDCRVVPLGHGFSLPDSVDAFPDWRPDLGDSAAPLAAADEEVLRTMNDWLALHGKEPLAAISDLYQQTDAQILATYPELDIWAPRRGPGSYFGTWSLEHGPLPPWSGRPGKRILAYLKPFSALPTLLTQLSRLPAESLVIAPRLSEDLRRQYRGTRVNIVSGPVDLPQAAADCDLAIGHGTHGFTACALGAGKPQLMIPLVQEQRLNATRVQEVGAGLVARCRDPQRIVQGLRSLWELGRYAATAREVAARWNEKSAASQVSRAVATILPGEAFLPPNRSAGQFAGACIPGR